MFIHTMEIGVDSFAAAMGESSVAEAQPTAPAAAPGPPLKRKVTGRFSPGSADMSGKKLLMTFPVTATSHRSRSG